MRLCRFFIKEYLPWCKDPTSASSITMQLKTSTFSCHFPNVYNLTIWGCVSFFNSFTYFILFCTAKRFYRIMNTRKTKRSLSQPRFLSGKFILMCGNINHNNWLNDSRLNFQVFNYRCTTMIIQWLYSHYSWLITSNLYDNQLN